MHCSHGQQPLFHIPRVFPSGRQPPSPPIRWFGCEPCNRLGVVQGERILAEEPWDGPEVSQEPDIDFGDTPAWDRIAAQMGGPDPQAWQQRWEQRHRLPPPPQFVRWVETHARQVPREQLRHRIQTEQFAEACAQASVRPTLRRLQPPVARLLQEALREGLREVIVEEKAPQHTASLPSTLNRLAQKKGEGNPKPEG